MIDFKKLSETYGTPLYLFDSNILKNRIEYLRKKLKGYSLVYAVKANTFIVSELEDEVERFEICSPGEFDVCDNLNIPHEKMVISGVYKDEDTIDRIMSSRDIGRFTIESISQYELLTHLTSKYQCQIHVLIRLTSGNQFGVNEEELYRIIKEHQENLIIDGIEFFSGTQKHSSKRVNKEIDYLNEIINKVETELNFEIKEIEYGPGLPIFYFQDDEFDEDTFLDEVSLALEKINHKRVSLEIGRSIAASCGFYLTKVVDLKDNKVGSFAIVDGGIHHLVYYGASLGMKIPHFEIIGTNTSEEKTYNIFGSLCTINDILVKNITIPKLKIGDIFVFKNTGAYSVTEGISLFLSRDLPKVLINTKNNEIKVVREVTKTSNLNFPNYER